MVPFPRQRPYFPIDAKTKEILKRFRNLNVEVSDAELASFDPRHCIAMIHSLATALKQSNDTLDIILEDVPHDLECDGDQAGGECECHKERCVKQKKLNEYVLGEREDPND
ncbi:MAG: hypothetical protein PHS95_00710 [Candidatus Pacebacteria bacterium]|nr:hypothetical protein [Candidatus Paceibacterota bacterium]